MNLQVDIPSIQKIGHIGFQLYTWYCLTHLFIPTRQGLIRQSNYLDLINAVDNKRQAQSDMINKKIWMETLKKYSISNRKCREIWEDLFL